MALDTTFEIETPEHIAFRYQLAGPAQRAAAYAIDILLRSVVLGVALILLVMISGDDSLESGFGWGVILVLFFVMEWGYFVFFEFFRAGQSPGKKVMRLRVVHQSGRPLALGDSVLRNFLRAADLLPTLYGIGVVTMIMDQKFRRLGDLVAQTIVVVEPPTQAARHSDTSQNVGISGIPARVTLSFEERAALSLFCRRKHTLSQARVEELANILAPKYIERFRLDAVPHVQLLETLAERSGAL